MFGDLNGSTALLAAGALTALVGCGGTEEDWSVDGESITEDAIVSSRCFPNRARRWTRRRVVLRRAANGLSERLSSVPKGALVRLADRNGDGRVCRVKKDADQPNWFISVRHGGVRGWIRVDALRATPPTQNPVPGYRITTPFGRPGGWAAGYHTGDDYACPTGTRVVATRPGRVKVVSRTAFGSAYGLHVVVQTGDVQHLYAHLSKAAVQVGQSVQQGTTIGRSGNSGNTTGPHLHYEERVSPYGYWNHRKPRFNR